MQVKRLDYIDALRGLAILFIVFGHIPMYCYHTSEALIMQELHFTGTTPIFSLFLDLYLILKIYQLQGVNLS